MLIWIIKRTTINPIWYTRGSIKKKTGIQVQLNIGDCQNTIIYKKSTLLQTGNISQRFSMPPLHLNMSSRQRCSHLNPTTFPTHDHDRHKHWTHEDFQLLHTALPIATWEEAWTKVGELRCPELQARQGRRIQGATVKREEKSAAGVGYRVHKTTMWLPGWQSPEYKPLPAWFLRGRENRDRQQHI